MAETILAHRLDGCRCGELTAEKLGNPTWVEFYKTHPVKAHFAECPEARPNCPLNTGLRPCMCYDMPRCPECNYSEHDARFEMDHDRCTGTIPARAPAQEVDRG